MAAPAANAYAYDRSSCNTPGTGADCSNYEADPEIVIRCGGSAAIIGLARGGPWGAAGGAGVCLLNEAL